jgi:hypothetical protein
MQRRTCLLQVGLHPPASGVKGLKDWQAEVKAEAEWINQICNSQDVNPALQIRFSLIIFCRGGNKEPSLKSVGRPIPNKVK